MAALFRQTSECQKLAGDWRSVLRLLSAGQPLSAEQVAAMSGGSATRLLRILRRIPIAEWSPDGLLVGLGVTLRPTPQQLRVAGRNLYAWSALDPLLLTVVLGQPLLVRTSCRVTGQPIRLGLSPDSVLEADPYNVVVSLPSHPEAPGACIWSIQAYLSFFRSAAVASSWLDEHPGYEFLPIREALAFARHLDTLLLRCACGGPAASAP